MSEHDFDTRDVDRWIGVPLGGGQMKDPVHVNDVRRWVQGMQNPNPLHFDEVYAAAGRHGRLTAPQTFAVCTDTSHGAGPAIQGVIPGQHMIFGGDEWWFFGPAIEPGDRITHDRMLFDYKVAETKFAGPTMFSRGDTTYVRQTGEIVCKQRSTSVRYLAENARAKGFFQGRQRREWTEAELLDQWWAPKPWRAETKRLEFTPGGQWVYAMVSPEGERHWALMNYQAISPRKSFTGREGFGDADGKLNAAMPVSTWTNSFSESDGTTTVRNEIAFDDLAQLENLIQMGFKEGYTMGLGNLEELLARLQKKAK